MDEGVEVLGGFLAYTIHWFTVLTMMGIHMPLPTGGSMPHCLFVHTQLLLCYRFLPKIEKPRSSSLTTRCTTYHCIMCCTVMMKFSDLS